MSRSKTGAECSSCRARYPADSNGQLDLRLTSPKRYLLEIEISQNSQIKQGFEFGPLKPNPSAVFDARRVAIPDRLKLGNRLSSELLSYFPRAAVHGGFMLDMACGKREFAKICELTNLEYIGLDRQESEPDILGDVHALPFKSDSFDFVLCMAALEHFKHPLVAMREAQRVLKPGGILIGTVAFLEPFHMDSYYHHSFLAVYNTLASAGFDVMHVAANPDWTALSALANMNLFYDLPRGFVEFILLPLRVLNRIWWMIEDWRYQTGGSWDVWRQLATTAGYQFVAVKPPVDCQRGAATV